MDERERKALVDAMGASVGMYLSSAKARNLPGMYYAIAKLTAGVGLLAQDLTEQMDEAKLAS